MRTGEWRARARRSGAFALAFAALYAAAVLIPPGQQFDAGTLGSFAWLLGWAPLIGDAARGPVPAAIALALALRAAWTAGAGRPLRALVMVALPLVTVLAGTMLREVLLVRPDLGAYAYPENTFPSVHAAGALAACAAMVPRRTRSRAAGPLMVLLIATAALVAVGSVSSFAHRGSDAVGGMLLAAALAAWLPARHNADAESVATPAPVAECVLSPRVLVIVAVAMVCAALFVPSRVVTSTALTVVLVALAWETLTAARR